MYLINTSFGWNVGDDFIRAGVERLLGIEDAPKIYLNRAQIRVGRDGAPNPRGLLWEYLANMPGPSELVALADGLVIAGTPEWIRGTAPLYEAAIRRELPIYIVGVGMDQGTFDHELLRRAAPFVRGATARDTGALKYLQGASIDAQWFPDPALVPPADRDRGAERGGMLVVYRAKGGNGTHAGEFDWFWEQVRDRFRGDVEQVTCHEPGELPLARRIFGQRAVFYSSEHADFARLYARPWRCISGRIHGAAPIVAAGGTALLAYPAGSWSWGKAECMRLVAEHTDRLRVQRFTDPLPESIEHGTQPWREGTPERPSLLRLVQDHMNYWRARMP